MSTPPCVKEGITFEEKKEFKVDKFIFKISFNEELMFIEINEEGQFISSNEFNIYINLEQFKKIDNYFAQFVSLSEVCDSFEELIRIKKLSIIKEEKNIRIKINNPILTKKEFEINIPIKEKDTKNEIENIISYVNKLNEKINSLEKKYDEKLLLLEQTYENKIQILENKIKNLEKKPKKDILKSNKNNFINNINNISIDSKIIQKITDFNFLNDKLESDFKGEVKYDLIYRATRDGPKTDDFNKKCNGKNNQLIILKTTKGVVFGGYTGRGFQNTNNGCIKDDSVFLYSIDNKKIYNIKKGSNALYELSSKKFGIFFGKCNGDNPIFLGSDCDMLSYESYTCPKSNTEYEFNFDYELNNGECNFSLQEIEVFQINKKDN